MTYIRDIISDELILYFLYGLVFVLLGFAVSLQNKKHSSFRLARKIWLLGLFGITHGFGEWIHAFIYLRTHYFNLFSTMPYMAVEKVLLVASFVFLFYFGIELFLTKRKGYRWLRFIPAILFMAWFFYFIYILVIRGGDAPAEGLLFGSLIARYTLAFPASLMTGYVMFFEMDEIRAQGIPHLNRVVKTAAVAFAAYAFFAGIVVPKVPVFPAAYINKESFLYFVGLPVEFFRMLCAMIITLSIIRSLEIFDIEFKKKIEAAEKKEAVIEERERISRDLHDGILQSIYSVGLRLEHCRLMHKDRPDSPEMSHILFSLDKLNEVMGDIRHYIQNLSLPGIKSDIRDVISELAAEFAANNPDLKVRVEIAHELPGSCSYQCLNHLYHVIKEALINVARHAGAKSVTIAAQEEMGSLKVTVIDDGQGFTVDSPYSEDGRQHYGLRNMAQRIEKIQGTFTLESEPGKGTRIIINLPKGEVA